VSPGCGHGARALELVRTSSASGRPGRRSRRDQAIATLEDAARWPFPGSPTIRVDGVDIDPEAPAGVGPG